MTQQLSPANLAHILYVAVGGAIENEPISCQAPVAAGLLERCLDGHWRLTPKGGQFVDMLLATPLPVERWIDPRTFDAPNANNPNL